MTAAVEQQSQPQQPSSAAADLSPCQWRYVNGSKFCTGCYKYFDKDEFAYTSPKGKTYKQPHCPICRNSLRAGPRRGDSKERIREILTGRRFTRY